MKTQQSAYEVLREIVEICGLDSVFMGLYEIIQEKYVQRFPDDTDLYFLNGREFGKAKFREDESK